VKNNTKLAVTRCGFRGAKNALKYVCGRAPPQTQLGELTAFAHTP